MDFAIVRRTRDRTLTTSAISPISHGRGFFMDHISWTSPIRQLAGRHRRVGELLAVLWILSLSDLFFTIWAHRFTPFYEMNPIARALLESGAIGLLIWFKLVMTATGSTIFWRTRRHGRAEIALWLIVVIYVLLAFQWSSYTSGAVMMAMR